MGTIGVRGRVRGRVVLVGLVAAAAAACDGDAGSNASGLDATTDVAGTGGTGTGGTGGGAGTGGTGGGGIGGGGTGGGGSGGGGTGGAGGSGGGTGGASIDAPPGSDGPLPADGPPPRLDSNPRDLPPAVDLAPPMPPPLHPAARRLLPARSVLLGLHRSTCSYGPASTPAGANRWCAVSRPGATLGTLDLWVLNVTKAAADPAGVMCSGVGNADCIKLTSNLYSSQPDVGPVYPTAHRFYGDTLIYYANAMSAPSELYRGPVYAWQPGWPSARQIASNNAVLCSGHSRANVAVCIENISPEGVMPVTWDVHAGPTDVGPMKKVATITPVHPTTEASQWASGFSTMGDYFVYSTPSAATGNRETLFFIKTSDIGTVAPTQVGDPGVSRWTLNGAGTKWFYLRDYNYNRQGEPSGTLYMRDFPGGATETRIQSAGAPPLIPGGSTRGVGTYQPLIDQNDMDAGLGLLVNVVGGRGNYRVMKNPAGSPDDPANVVSVVNDVATLPTYSPDLRFYYYAKAVDAQVGTTDTWVVKSDGTGSCALTQSLSSSIFGFPFTADSSLMFWMDNFDAATDSGEGWVANPDGCANKRRFASSIDFWFVDGAKTLLFSDDSDGRFVTLRYAPVQSGQLGMPVVGQRQIDRMFGVLPNFEGVLFSITSNNAAVDGVYHLPLPPP